MWPLSARHSASPYKISSKSDNRSMNYDQKSDFQDGGCRHLEIRWGIKRSSSFAGALSGHRRPSSVRLSDVAYIGSNSKAKRPRKTKLCTGVPHVTCDYHTDIKVKRSEVKVTGSISAAQRNVPIFRNG